MGTPCYIGYADADGTVRAVYIHYDGYPDFAGKYLLEHHASDELARSVVGRGSRETIGSRERYLNADTMDRRFDSIDDYMQFWRESDNFEYAYLWLFGRWHMMPNEIDWRRLEPSSDGWIDRTG